MGVVARGTGQGAPSREEESLAMAGEAVGGGGTPALVATVTALLTLLPLRVRKVARTALLHTVSVLTTIPFRAW